MSTISFGEAAIRFMAAVGEGAMRPSRNLSSVSHNGTWTLRNVRGHLGIVTSTGKVFDRPAGTRLDQCAEVTGAIDFKLGELLLIYQHADYLTRAMTAEAQSVLELVAERLAARELEEDFTLHAAVRAAIARLDAVHEALHEGQGRGANVPPSQGLR